MKNFNFSWLYGRTLRRVGLVLVMCLMAISQVWADDHQHYVGCAIAPNTSYYDEVRLNVNRATWGYYQYSTVQAGLTFEGKDLYMANYQTKSDANNIYNFQWQLYKSSSQKWSRDLLNGSEANNYYDNYIYNYDGESWYEKLTMNDSRMYFDATNWSETNIRLVISHAHLQKYHDMYTVSGTKLWYCNDLSSWTDAMGFGVVGGETGTGADARVGNQTEYWQYPSDISDKAVEYTGLRHYGLNNNGDDVYYLVVNNGSAGESPGVSYGSDYTSLNSTQTYNTVVKVGAGSYTSANSKATISISSYELTSQGSTTNRTPSISTSASSTTVSACRTATTRLQVGTVDGDYQFDGWYTAATGGSLVSNSTDYTYYPTSANTYYARFSQKAYTLTYYANGGTGSAPAAETIYSGNTITVKDNINRMTKSGKVFAGWAKGTAHRDAGTVDYIPGVSDTFTADGDVDLYAIWKDGSYFISITNPTTNGEKNTTDFVSTQNLTNTARTVNGVTFSKSYYNTSGSISSSNKIKGYNETSKYIIYDAKTTVSKVRVYMKHNSGSTTTANIYYYVAKEGVDPGDNQTFALTNGSEKVLEVDLSSTKGARFVIGTDQYQRADFTQIIAIEEGTAFPSVGETGYQVSFPGRTATIKEVDYSFNGLTINSASPLKIDGGDEVFVVSEGSRFVSFTTSASTQLQVTTGNSTEKFVVCTNKSSAASTGKAYGGSKNTQYNINLTSTGTFYIIGNSASNAKIKKIAFADHVAATKPTSLTVGSITSTTARFTITDGTNSEWEIYWSTSNTAPTASTVPSETGLTSKTYDATGLTAGTTYYAWVRAVADYFNKSDWTALTDDSFETDDTPTHTVTAATSTGTDTYGTVSSADASVAEGSTTTITAVPATGYRVTNWAVSDGDNGASISPSGASNATSTTLTMGTANATVTVTFGAKSYTVTLNNQSATSPGTESVSTTYAANTNLTSAITCPTKSSKVFAGYFTGTNGSGVQLIDPAGNWIASAGGGSTYLDGSKKWKYDGDLTLYACWMNYASTLDFKTEAAKGTPTAISTFLTSGNMVISSTDNVSWDNDGTGYEGLKIKKSERKLLLLVESGKKMSITLGLNNNAKISKNGGAEADLTKSTTTNFGPMDADTLFAIRTTSDGAVSIQKITIEDPCTSPTIGSQPSNVSICPGNTTTLTVGSITGGNTPYTYQWYDASNDAAMSTGSGYTSASFTTPTLNAAASYYCIVTENGGCTTQSSTAAVSMKTTTAITSQPSSVANANVKSSTSLSVTATGTNLSYQWYTCDDDQKTNADDLDGETDATLSITPDEAGVTYYYCVVTGDCGTETSNVVSITAKNAISPTLSYSSTVLVGGTISPTLEGNTGSGSVSYALNDVTPAGSLTINTSTGVVTGVTAGGTATVTATIAATASYWGNTATSETITVAKADLSVSPAAGTASSVTHNSATLPFTLSSTTGVASVTLNVYDASDDSEPVKTVSGVTAATSGSGDVTGLSASTTYYFTVTPIGDSNHNDGAASSKSSTFTTEAAPSEACWDPANDEDDKLSSGDVSLSTFEDKFDGISGVTSVTIETKSTSTAGGCSGSDDSPTALGYMKVKNASENKIITIITSAAKNITIGGEQYGSNSGSFYLVKSTDTSTKLAECATGETAKASNCVAGTYYIYAKASTKSINFSKLCIEDACSAPGKPAGLRVEEGTLKHKGATFSWDRESVAEHSDGYVVSIAKVSDGSTVLDWTDEDIYDDYFYDASGLMPATSYYFIVKSKGADGYCEYGDTARVQFTTNNAQITYVYNGATGGASPATATGGSVTLPTPTRTNYDFDGWYVGSTKIGDAGDTYALPDTIKAYAKWKKECAGGGGEPTVLFSQNFNSATAVAYDGGAGLSYSTSSTLSNCVGSGSNLFTSLTSVSGQSSSGIAVNSSTGAGSTNATGVFQVRKKNSSYYWSIIRTSDFAATAPTALKVSMDIWYDNLSSGSNVGVQFAIGDDFVDGLNSTSPQSTSNVHSGFNILDNSTAKIAQYASTTAISENGITQETWLSLVWVINNTGSSFTYDDPDGSGTTTLADDKFDIWLKTKAGAINTFTKVVSAQAATTGAKALQNIYIGGNGGSQHLFMLDSIVISDISSVTASSCFYVTYDGNGADAGFVHDSLAYPKDTTIWLKPSYASTGYTRKGYEFNGWCNKAEPDEESTLYDAWDDFDLTQDTTLYARWKMVIDKDNTDFEGYDSPTEYKDVRVTNGATLTITEDTEIRDITVESGATLNIAIDDEDNGVTLSVNSLSLEGGWTRINKKDVYDMPRVYINPKSTLTKSESTVNFDIAVDNRNFYPIALPYEVALSAVNYKDPALASYVSSHDGYSKYFVVRTYNGENRAKYGTYGANWDIVWDGTLKPGIGYILRAVPKQYEDYAVIRFPMTVANEWTAGGEKGKVTISETTYRKDSLQVVAYTGTATASGKNNKGWNLLGVPYMSCYQTGDDMYDDENVTDPATLIQGHVVIGTGAWIADEVRYVTIPNHNFSDYIQANIEDEKTILKPGWCFFIQTETTGSLIFLKNSEKESTGLPYYAPRRANAPLPTVKTGIILSSETASDKTTILVSDKYSAEEYEINADLEKMFGEDSYTLATYSLMGETRMAYNAISNADIMNVIPIGYRAPADGEYTFSINPRYAESEAFQRVELIDYQEGIITDLLQYSYTFATERTQNDGRFALNVVRKQPEVTTDIEATGDTESATGVKKVIINDKLFIIRDGAMYDATGKRVKGGK